ncbi:MAG TPA: response regulator [Candidatus Binataceae bacterium]|nr:response regulator [Candidatus Binataceae bacterium]
MSVRVLIVDDSVFTRDVLRQHLECLQCSVIAEAENTLQALDLFHTVNPDLVALDVGVAQTGGIGAMALFRIMRSEAPDLPILAISGFAYPELCKAYLKEGALDYLKTPFNAQSFARVRNRLVEIFPELNHLPPPPAIAQAAGGR